MSIEAVRLNNIIADNNSNHLSVTSGAAAVKPQNNPSVDPAVKEAAPEKKENTSDQVAAAVNVANDFMKLVDTGLEYEFDQKIDREIVRIYNRATGEVIKQIPADDVVKMLTKMYDMLGVLYDKKF